LEASRAERLRLNGNGALTLEDARTWIEETGLCLFLPRRQFSVGVAPSFVEAISGTRNPTPDPKHIALAEELLVRLEADGVAVRLNLLGQPGEQPDFVVAAWVLPYVYALRGDRDWRRSPQLTGSRQVSQLAIQAYKVLESGDATIPQLKHTLGKEVTEGAVLRAITELWQQLRIIPIVSAPGRPAQWQLLRQRFQKAIAEGASTSQVTAISVLASIYLQAVIAASMEEVELFLASLTARSKVREVLRGLVATRQVHTISMGHAPHFYVAGTLPEFAVAPTIYASSAMAASSYFLHAREREEEFAERVSAPPAKVSAPVPPAAHVPAAPAAHIPPAASAQFPGSPAARVPASAAARASILPSALAAARIAAESQAQRIPAAHQPASNGKPAAARPHFSRPAARSRDRKPAQASSGNRPARRPNRDTRPSSGTRTPNPRTASSRPSGTRTSGTRPSGTRPSGARTGNGSRATSGARWTPASNGNGHGNGSSNGNGRHTTANGNGAHGNGSHGNGNGRHTAANGNGTRGNGSHGNGAHANGSASGAHANGNGHGSSGNGSRNGSRNGHTSNGHASNGHAANGHVSSGASNGRNGKAAPASRTQRNGHANSGRAGSGKPAAKPTVNARGSAVRKDARAGGSRKPALTAGAKAGNSKRYGFTAPAKQGTKKRG
jgi:hypothetical protein